ncbi:MAG: DNA repair protein RecO [Christensenellales bacterium]
MDKKFIGIVIRVVDYKEKDKLVNIFSASEGLVFGKFKSVKGAGSKLKVLASPFCLAEFTGVQTNDKLIITGGEVIDTFFDITADIDKYYVACCVLDFTNFILKYMGEDFQRLFACLISALKVLCYKSVQPKIVLIKFICEVLQFCGLSLQLKTCINCGAEIEGQAFIDVLDCAVKCENCKGEKNIIINNNELQLLNKIIAYDFDSLSNLSCENELQVNLIKILGNYVYCQFDYILKLEQLID